MKQQMISVETYMKAYEASVSVRYETMSELTHQQIKQLKVHLDE